MQNALSAVVGNFEIIDLVVIGIIALTVLLGLAKGFAKFFRGFFGSIIALGAAVAVIILFKAELTSLSFIGDLENTILSKLGGLGAMFNNPAKLESGAILILQDNGWVAFPDSTGNTTLKMVAQYGEGIIAQLVGPSLNGTNSIASVLSGVAATIVAYVVGFAATAIVVKIALLIISSIFVGITNSRKGLKRIDRLLGLILGAALSFVLVFAVFLLFKKFPNTAIIPQIIDMIESSTSVAKWIWDLVTV